MKMYFFIEILLKKKSNITINEQEFGRFSSRSCQIFYKELSEISIERLLDISQNNVTLIQNYVYCALATFRYFCVYLYLL